MSKVQRLHSNIAVESALRKTDGFQQMKIPSHLRRITKQGGYVGQRNYYGSPHKRSHSGLNNKQKAFHTQEDASPERYYYQNTDRARSAIGKRETNGANGGVFNAMLQGQGTMSKPHLAAIMKQISGSNYHAYKIDETPEQITCYLFQKRFNDRLLAKTNPLGTSQSPLKMASHYKQSFRKAGMPPPPGSKKPIQGDSAFNLEKEHRIINPHKMDLRTTNRDEFKAFNVVPNPARKQYVPPDKMPFQDASIYKKDFPNWKVMPGHIEKHPQYPVYSLPFKGESLYRGSFAKSGSAKSLKPYAEETQTTHFHGAGPKGSAIKGTMYAPMRFKHETTKQVDYKPFKIDANSRRMSRQQVVARKNEAEILTKSQANPFHFQTSNSRDYRKIRYINIMLDEEESVPPTPVLRSKYRC